VSDQKKTAALLGGNLPKKKKNIPASLRVKRSGRLIRKENRSLSGNRTGDGYALSFPYGKLIRSSIKTVTQSHSFENFTGPFPDCDLPHAPYAQANGNIFNRRKGSEKVKGLKNHPAVGTTVPIKL